MNLNTKYDWMYCISSHSSSPASWWAEPHRHAPLSLSNTLSHVEFLPEETSHSQDEGEHGSCGTHTVVPGRVWTRSGVCVMSWGCGLKYLFSLPPVLQQAGVCSLRAPDDFSRLEMVQRLAKDGYRFLQNQNYRLPDRSAQVDQRSLWPASVGIATAGQGSD